MWILIFKCEDFCICGGARWRNMQDQDAGGEKMEERRTLLVQSLKEQEQALR
jgi:hypothetical protein